MRAVFVCCNCMNFDGIWDSYAAALYKTKAIESALEQHKYHQSRSLEVSQVDPIPIFTSIA